jgi:hypothetical protein
MSTQRSTAAVEGLAKTDQLGSNRLDIAGDDMRTEQLRRPGAWGQVRQIAYWSRSLST